MTQLLLFVSNWHFASRQHLLKHGETLDLLKAMFFKRWGNGGILRKGNSNGAQGSKEVGLEIQLETQVRSYGS